jgi:hypothetical protein
MGPALSLGHFLQLHFSVAGAAFGFARQAANETPGATSENGN